MKKIEFDGIIGAVDEKPKCIILRVGTEVWCKKDDGTYESQTEWINCIMGLETKGKIRVGDRYLFRGDFNTEAYKSSRGEDLLKVQITVFVTEKPYCLYRKKDQKAEAEPTYNAPVPLAPDDEDLPF